MTEPRDTDFMEPFRVQCRCVACRQTTWQLSTYEPDRGKTKTWFCGCAPPVDGEFRAPAKYADNAS